MSDDTFNFRSSMERELLSNLCQRVASTEVLPSYPKKEEEVGAPIQSSQTY